MEKKSVEDVSKRDQMGGKNPYVTHSSDIKSQTDGCAYTQF